MPKYSMSRKISPKRFFPEFNFESVDFTVEGCDSPQQAMDEVNQWIIDWVKDTKKRNMKDPVAKFKKELEETGEAFSKTIKIGKTKKIVNFKEIT